MPTGHSHHSSLKQPARLAWKAWVWLRYMLCGRWKLKREVSETAAGFRLRILPGVFNPALFETGALLAECVLDLPLSGEEQVLDLGTGSGVCALAAASKGCRVVATDLNPAALRCARDNARENQLEEAIQFCRGDLFTHLRRASFDLILFNPPYLEGRPTDLAEAAFRAPGMLERFAKELADHLRPGGCALIVLSTTGRGAWLLNRLQREGWDLETLVKKDRRSEVLSVHRIR